MNCPLCNKYLLEIENADVSGASDASDYICQTRIKFDGITTLPHYECRVSNAKTEVCWYIPPYQIIAGENETVVNIADKAFSGKFYSKPTFKHVFTIPEKIHPDEPEKLLKRIKLLTLFS